MTICPNFWSRLIPFTIRAAKVLLEGGVLVATGVVTLGIAVGVSTRPVLSLKGEQPLVSKSRQQEVSKNLLDSLLGPTLQICFIIITHPKYRSSKIHRVTYIQPINTKIALSHSLTAQNM